MAVKTIQRHVMRVLFEVEVDHDEELTSEEAVERTRENLIQVITSHDGWSDEVAIRHMYTVPTQVNEDEYI